MDTNKGVAVDSAEILEEVEEMSPEEEQERVCWVFKIAALVLIGLVNLTLVFVAVDGIPM